MKLECAHGKLVYTTIYEKELLKQPFITKEKEKCYYRLVDFYTYGNYNVIKRWQSCVKYDW